MASRNPNNFWRYLLGLSLLLAACQPARPTQNAEVVEESSTVEPTVQPTPTMPPTRSLVVCLSQEPTTLYLYGGNSRSMWSVLEAVYDGPYDKANYTAQPVILEKMPSLVDGDAYFEPVAVRRGEQVVDADGNQVVLDQGVRVRPSGCAQADCVVTWDGTSPLNMDRMSIKFSLLPGITWSDGEPLTARDTVFSFQIASDDATPVSKQWIYLTESYQTVDEHTVRWTGKPGAYPLQYETLFWIPLPEHLLQGYSAAELLQASAAVETPLGWGPYTVKEWVKGDHIELEKNPLYFRAGEGLPKFDKLVYRFLGLETDDNLAALLSGECDVVDQNTLTDEELEILLDLEKSEKLRAFIGVGPEWEHVDFGIKPAAYDDGYNLFEDTRQDIFSDVRVRKAFAMCMDRQQIIERWMLDQSAVPATYLPPSHPLYASDLITLPYDPLEGSRLLDEVGWKNVTGDPRAPRQAFGVPNVLDGTELVVNYATTQASLRVKITEMLAESMAECGIRLHVQYLDPGKLYAPGPEGVMFGRKFDLVQFGWESGTQPPCLLYESDQIPSEANDWIGVNIAGYSNPRYDQACLAARQTYPDQAEAYRENQLAVQRLFAEELPVIPLYYRLRVAAGRPDLCGFEMDISARSALWNLERLDYGEGCQ